MKLESQILNDAFLTQKYDLIQKLGEGCFGKIYKVKNKQLNINTALKLEILQKNTKKTMLENEAQLLQLLQDKPFVPSFHNFGNWSMGTYIEIQLLQKDLNSLVDQIFSIDQIGLLTVKLLQSLSVLHNSNIIHQDIKPQNIMINSKGDYVFIDYGISKKLNPQTINPQNQLKRTKGFIGTPRYASIAAHKGFQQSKKDDLQSLFYNIAFLYFKKLPWLSLRVPGNRKIEEIRMIKQKTADEVFQQMGKPFSMAFNYIKKLNHMQEPNYKYLYSLFKRNNTVIVDTFTPHQFGVMKKQNQKVSIMRSSQKKNSLNPNQNYGNYLHLPMMGKQGFTDNIMTLDRSIGDSHNNMGSMNSSGSRGFSMRAYYGMDQIVDDDYESFERDMNIDEQEDKQPSVRNIAKFCSPLLLKNPFSNKY